MRNLWDPPPESLSSSLRRNSSRATSWPPAQRITPGSSPSTHTLTMATVAIVTGTPVYSQVMKPMVCPSRAAMPAVTMLADAAMSVPLPPRQAPKASAQVSTFD